MAIKKTDNSSYVLGGKDTFKTYRPENNQDINLLDKLDQEQIELGGSTVIYYPCYIDTNFDQLYMESIDSIIAQEGYKITAAFKPVRPAQSMSAFGIDSADEVFFNFNLTFWKNAIGEMPRIKSIIFCEWDKSYWEIIQSDNERPYKLWNKYRLQVHTKKYQQSRGDKHPTRKDAGDHTLNVY